MNPVELTFCKEPERVIPINQNMTELLLYFGLADRIVACGFADNEILPELWEDYDTLIQLKGKYYPQRVVVESFKPDLIMGWRSAFAEKALGSTQEWERKGIHTLKIL